jgi:hypothetical protein|tara:strand:- start:33 stop:536 length:504 start_codon:yes stop_codon:yes gene_type:complete
MINEIKNHTKIKKQLLSYIKEAESDSLDLPNEVISRTDYYVEQNLNSPNSKYWNLMLEHIRPTYNNIAKKLCSKKWTIHNSWFQQYENKDEHPWHVHPTCQFSNVYYVELPNKNLVTQFIDKKIDAEEGCLITFPSYIYHRSAINNTNKRKTIISFNSSFQDYYDYS